MPIAMEKTTTLMGQEKFLVYRASAGSGKTFTLVREYLALALNGSDGEIADNFRHILAITFTNKATNEMKARILEYASKLQDTEKRDSGAMRPMTEALCYELGIKPDELSRRAALLEKAVLHNYSDFSVCTIDSFMNRIVRTFAIDLGLSPRFEITMDTDILLEKAVDSLIADISDQHPELTATILKFSQANMEDGGSFRVRYQILDSAQSIMKEEFVSKLEMLRDIPLEKFGEFSDILRGENRKYDVFVRNSALEICGDIESKALTDDDFNKKSNGVFAYFRKVAENGAEKVAASPTICGIFENQLFANSKAKNTAAIDQLAPVMTQAFNAFQQGYRMFLARKVLLHNIFQMALLKEVQSKLDTYYSENEILHISENNKRISEAVQNEQAPFIFERLGCRYRHFLVDEFQDTSIMQWQNILPLIENGLSEGYKSLIVGDGKQAIYRFRQGDVEQFQYVLQTPQNASPITRQRYQTIIRNGAEVNLDTNFRSYGNVVDFNNRLFSYLENCLYNGDTGSQLMHDIYIGETPEKPLLLQKVAPNKIGGGYVEIHFYDAAAVPEDEPALPAASVYETIKHLKSIGYLYKDIVILARTNDQLSELSAELTAINNEKGELDGLMFSSAESLKLSQNSEAKFLRSLLGFLFDENNRVISLEIAEYLLFKNQWHFDIAMLANATEFSSALAGAFPQFNRDWLVSQTLYDCCYELIRIFGIPKTPYIYTFLNKVSEYSVYNRNNLGEFLDWLGEKWDSLSTKTSDDLDAIRLMTVHKSKGLEFPVVIYHMMESKQRSKAIWVDMKDNEFAETQPLEVGLVNISKEMANSAFENEYRSELRKSEIDKLNVFYVALTRPEQHLYIFTPQPPAKPGNIYYSIFLKDFLKDNGFETERTDYEEIYAVGNRDFREIKQSVESEVHYLDDNASRPWSDDVCIVGRSDSIMQYRQTEQQQVGNMVHDILSKIGTLNEAETVTANFLSETKTDKEVSDAAKRLIQSVLHSTEVCDFFNPEYDYKTECEILHNGEIVRPDRIVFTPEETWVVDFKTGLHEDKHIAQVNAYKTVLKDMGFPCVKGFLMYISNEGCHVEEV